MIFRILLWGGILGFVPAAWAKILQVGQGGSFTSVREAIRAAEPGDTIRVQRGTYSGNLFLDKRLALEGIGKPVIRGDGKDSVITVLADGCAIRGFVVERSGPMLVYEDSGILLKSDNNRIEGNELRDILFGIYLYQSDGNTIRENVISGRPHLESGERGSGIHIWDSVNNTILRNAISQERDGMYLQNANRSFISGNRVHDLRYGLHYMFSDDNRFEDNDFFNNVAGAAIMYSKNIVFRRNAFVRNRGFSSYGILFQDSLDCVAEENTISDNTTGVFMEALNRSVFRRNTIAANDIAIQAFSSASQDVFTENNFVANLSPFQLVGKVTDIRWTVGTRGNYWSEYDGYDLDGNGIGDVEFRIQNAFEHLEGNYPRLRIYLSSPASSALAASQRLLPILDPPKTADRYPLMRPMDLEAREPERIVAAGRRIPALVIACALILVAALILAWGRAAWSTSLS